MNKKAENPAPYPWLVYLGAHSQTFCRISSSGPVSSESKDILALNNAIILYCSPDGKWWLLLHSFPTADGTAAYEQEISIWNPTTQESIGLPCLRQDLQDIRFPNSLGLANCYGLLSSSPSDPNCLILLFLSKAHLILYCRLGDENWKGFEYSKSIKAQTADVLTSPLCHPVSVGGKIYAMAVRDPCRDLVEICFDNFNICKVRFIKSSGQIQWNPPGGSASWVFLVASGDQLQELYLIRIIHDVVQNTLRSPAVACSNAMGFREPLEVKVYRFLFSSNLWEKVTSLKRRALFMGSHYSLSSRRLTPPPVEDDHDDESDNKSSYSYIYFNFGYDQPLYSYRVEDERITSYLPCPTRFPVCTQYWIMPDVAGDNYDHLVEHEQRSDTRMMMDLWKNLQQKSTAVSWIHKKRGSSMCDLSSEVLGFIAENLSFVDFMQFRCVNKACASSTIRRRTKPFPPCLIYRDRGNGVYNIIDHCNNLNQKISVKIPNILDDYRICCSKNGWLLLDNYQDVSFFNPFTAQIVPIAHGPRKRYEFSNFTFLSKPSSSDCSVLATTPHITWDSSELVICIANPDPRPGGPTNWRKLLRKLNQPMFIQSCNTSPVFLKDQGCYYLGNNGKLGHLKWSKDFEQGSFQWEVIAVRCPCIEYKQNYLSECDGELVSVFVGGDRVGKTSWIQVFKLNQNKNWEEIDSLGGYSLYLSRPSSISSLAETPDMANRIYFPNFYKDGLVYYSLNTKKFHANAKGRQVTLRSLYQTSRYLDCAWIEPNWG